MAIQILPEEGSLGGSLGTAIGTGINSLIERKLQDLHKAQAVNERKATYKKAQLPEWLAELPEDMQTLLLKEYDLAPEPEKQAIKQELDQMTQEFHAPDEDREDGGLPAQLQQSPMNMQASQMQQAERSTIPGMNTLQQAGQAQRSSEGQSSPVQAFPEKGRGVSGAPAPQGNFEPQVPEQPRGLQRKQKLGGQLTATALREKGTQERFAHKETSKYVNGIYDMEKSKNEEDNVLKRIIKVSEKDDARNPVLSGIMKQIGIDYQGLQNNDTLELGKLERWFLRGGVKMFGGRVSNAEMGVLLSQVPSMLQTKEGRIRLAKQMLLANQDFHDEFETVHRIERENGGKAPLNIRFQVEEEMGPKREKNADAFINGIYGDNTFKVGQKTDDISRLPDGAEVTGPDGKDYVIKNGKPVLKG